jgi:nucleoid-associated protein YgaU
MIGRRSRYTASILYTSAEGDFLGVRPSIDTGPRPDDRFHTVVEGDRVDLLAHRYLGRADLWWIICDYNDIFFPLELEPGSVLRIPSVEHVQMELIG